MAATLNNLRRLGTTIKWTPFTKLSSHHATSFVTNHNYKKHLDLSIKDTMVNLPITHIAIDGYDKYDSDINIPQFSMAKTVSLGNSSCDLMDYMFHNYRLIFPQLSYMIVDDKSIHSGADFRRLIESLAYNGVGMAVLDSDHNKWRCGGSGIWDSYISAMEYNEYWPHYGPYVDSKKNDI